MQPGASGALTTLSSRGTWQRAWQAAGLASRQTGPSTSASHSLSHVCLLQELEERFQVEYIAGGATQNSIRVAQWMLQVRAAGCVARRGFGVPSFARWIMPWRAGVVTCGDACRAHVAPCVFAPNGTVHLRISL